MDKEKRRGTDKPPRAGRSRGVKASRVLLDKAMADAGFRSQASLAAAIAEAEGLEVPPKDLINRVFTEKAVDPSSIQRVAQVLLVEATSLYLSSPVAQPKPDPIAAVPGSGNEADLASKASAAIFPTPVQKPLWAGLILGLAILLAWGIWLLNSNATSPAKSERASAFVPAKLAVISGSGKDALNWPNPTMAAELAAQLRSSTGEHNVELVDNLTGEAWQSIAPIGVDFIIEPFLVDRPRHQGLVVYLVSERLRVAIYYGAWPKWSGAAASEQLVPLIVEGLGDQLRHLAAGSAALHSPPAQEILSAHLTGETLMDGPLIDEVVTLAQTQFYRALRLDDGFVPARVGLCSTLVGQSIARADKSYLKDAQTECAKVAAYAKSQPEVGTALGNLQRKLGSVSVAEATFIETLQRFPNYTEAQIGLGETYIALARKGNGVDYYQKAKMALADAAEIEPEYWRIPFSLARVHYFEGDIPAAIAAGEASLALDKNLNTLSNLATSEFCYGSLSKAKNYYEAMLTLDFRDPITEGQLSSVYFFLGDYSQAARLSEQYLASMESRGEQAYYQARVNLGDIYRVMGNSKEALANYRAVLSPLQSHRLNGEDNHLVDAQILHVKIAIELLSEAQENFDQYSHQAQALMAVAKDPTTQVYLLMVLALLDRPEVGAALYSSLRTSCAGFVGHPDLQVYAQKH